MEICVIKYQMNRNVMLFVIMLLLLLSVISQGLVTEKIYHDVQLQPPTD